MGDVLVVAFDGLDRDLIKQYGCTSLMQEEFGRIDNDTGTHQRMTSELYTSFITGETFDVHGVTGLTTWSKPRAGQVLETLTSSDSLPRRVLQEILDVRKVKWEKNHLPVNTIFDEVPGSKAMYVPGYNPSWFWRVGPAMQTIQSGGSIDDAEQVWEREFQYRKRKFMAKLKFNDYPLFMVQFHKPDTWQHLYAYDGVVDEEKIREVYREMDSFAAEILEYAEGKYDDILFMSDHGLPMPDREEHNREAFYSWNTSKGWEVPHITDFYPYIKVVTLSEENRGLDV